jgi:hypothetical protein
VFLACVALSGYWAVQSRWAARPAKLLRLSDAASHPSTAPPRLSANAEDYRPYLQMQFLQQAPDVSWARQAKSELDTGLGHLLDKRSSMTSIECRSSLCRVELMHQDESAYASFADAFAHAKSQSGKGQDSSPRRVKPTTENGSWSCSWPARGPSYRMNKGFEPRRVH